MTRWVFGYGSIVWKPSFEYEAAYDGYVKGFQRRFWQGSPDHRGTPEALGRVVTLIPADKDSIVHGRVFKLKEEVYEEIMKALDHREKAGYEKVKVSVHTPEGPIEAITFIATEENEYFLGPAAVEEVAAQIHSSVGPSGPNLEYFQCLHAAMMERKVVDEHLEELHAAIEKLKAKTLGSK